MRYEVRVKLHKNYIQVFGNVIEIGITVSPEKGKANAEVIRKLANHFKVPQSFIRIIKGSRSRNKIIELNI